jgi:SPP1 gp7 family putative phage head morphogenesis protein
VVDDILKHAHQVEARANALADDMVKALEAVQGRLIEKLAAVQAKLQKDWQNESLKRRKKLLELQRSEVAAILADLYQGKAPDMLQAAAHDTMQGSASFTVKTMNEVSSLSVKLGHGITKELVKAWTETSTCDGLLINDWLSKLEKSAADRIISVGRQAMIEGLPVNTMARMLRAQGIEGSVPGLRGLASTFMHSASAHARETTINRHFSKGIKGWRWLATLDRRTCLKCGPNDGKFVKQGDPKPALPRHWRCRCLWLPVVKNPISSGGSRPAVKHIKERTIQHRDGSTSTKWKVKEAEQVPVGTTYNAWLKGQLETDPAFVRSVLGKTRFELFKAGKITLNSMTTRGRIKSLAELQR